MDEKIHERESVAIPSLPNASILKNLSHEARALLVAHFHREIPVGFREPPEVEFSSLHVGGIIAYVDAMRADRDAILKEIQDLLAFADSMPPEARGPAVYVGLRELVGRRYMKVLRQRSDPADPVIPDKGPRR